MQLEYDLHLSAHRISRTITQSLERLGFVRDEFTNNTRCVASEYHATFRGSKWVPDQELWTAISGILRSDGRFIGCLEEEAIAPGQRRVLLGEGLQPPGSLPPIVLAAMPPAKHKACDIHIGVDLFSSSTQAVAHLEQLEAIAFDKPTPEGIRRVYSLTCETQLDGERLFQALYDNLSKMPGLRGKMKLEITTKYLRYPDSAPTLPLTPTNAVSMWLASLRELEREVRELAVNENPSNLVDGEERFGGISAQWP